MRFIQKIKESYLFPALEWSERYARTDMLYIFKGSFWTSFSFGASSLLSLILVIAFANLLPKETYGTYKYVMSFSGILGFLTFTGMNIAVSQMVAQGHDAILPYAVKIQLRFNLLFTGASAILVGYYLLHDNTTLAASLAILGIAFPLIAAFNTYGAYLNGKQRFRESSAYSTATSAIYVAVMVLALTFTKSVPLLVLAYSLANLVPVLFIYWKISRTVRQRPTEEEEHQLLHYGSHLSVLNVLSTINAYIDSILVFHYAGAVQLAVYGLADAIPSRLKGYMKSIVGIAFPKLAQKQLADIRRGLWLRAVQTFLLGTVATAVYWFVAPTVFRVFFPKYLESIRYSQLIMLNFIFLPFVTYQAFVFQSQRMIREIYISSLSVNILRLALYVLFANLYGIIGIIWALIISNAFAAIINFFLLEHGSSRPR